MDSRNGARSGSRTAAHAADATGLRKALPRHRDQPHQSIRSTVNLCIQPESLPSSINRTSTVSRLAGHCRCVVLSGAEGVQRVVQTCSNKMLNASVNHSQKVTIRRTRQNLRDLLLLLVLLLLVLLTQ